MKRCFDDLAHCWCRCNRYLDIHVTSYQYQQAFISVFVQICLHIGVMVCDHRVVLHLSRFCCFAVAFKYISYYMNTELFKL